MESLDARTRQEERLLLELRTSEGVDRELLQDLGVSPRRVSERIAAGQLRLGPGGRIVPTLEGRLLVDGIVLDFLTN
jgi:coproporphyrinogen III oxidase-like Fe-S oxidoreductase